MPNFSNNDETIIADIIDLQKMEQDLFSSLETNSSLSSSQQNKILDQISQLSSMRGNLYQTLSGINNFYENALETSVGTLKEQIVAIGIVESELNQAKKRLKMLKNDRNDKIRLVEINDYYGEKYAEHSQFMKIVIYTLIPIIILTVLNKKNILPNNIFYVLVILISVIGAVMGWTVFFSIVTRNNMNYQTYDWYFDPNTAPQPSTNPNNAIDPWLTTPSISCIGAACCSSNQTFDASTNLCVNTIENFDVIGLDSMQHQPPSKLGGAKSNITESMIESILKKQDPNKYKADVNLAPTISGVNQNKKNFK
jgi:hypothetical protein